MAKGYAQDGRRVDSQLENARCSCLKSAFLGIVIRFYYNDHLPPHFHADYAEHQAQIAIGSHAVLKGRLPGRVLGLVQEWAELTASNSNSVGNRLVAAKSRARLPRLLRRSRGRQDHPVCSCKPERTREKRNEGFEL